MSIDVWIFYILTILAMMSTPGPSQILMLSNSARYGFKNSLATACGDISANILQMIAAALGVGVLIVTSQSALTFIKWLGVAYLIWYACRTILRNPDLHVNQKGSKIKNPLKTLYMQGFLTSATNPRAVIFFAALFPQFMSSDGSYWLQFFILSMTYIVIDMINLSLYGYSAQWIIARIKPTSNVWLNRISGGLMFVAALLLGFKSLDNIRN